jgi:hypothetical protein
MASSVRTWRAATAPAPTMPIRTVVAITAGYGATGQTGTDPTEIGAL